MVRIFQFPKDFIVTDFIESYLQSAIERSYLFDSYSIKADKIFYNVAANIDSAEVESYMQRIIKVCLTLTQENIYTQTLLTPFCSDAMQDLLDAKSILRIAESTYVFQGKFLSLMKFFDQCIIQLANQLDATEQYYPVRWPIDLFKKINYFKEFPQNIMIVSGVKKDHFSLSNISKQYDKSQQFSEIVLDDSFAPATFALGTSTCDPCYYAMSQQKSVSNAVYTAVSKSFRNEEIQCDGLDRLREFTMREVIVVGNSDFVLEKRFIYIEFVKAFLKFIQLPAKIETANDPFFTNDALLKNAFQSAINSKYEVLIDLAFLGKALAVGSINWHGDHFGKMFDACHGNEHHIHSGCLAFGLERLTYAFVCHYGLEESNWPTTLSDQFHRYLKGDKLDRFFDAKILRIDNSSILSKVIITNNDSDQVYLKLSSVFQRAFGKCECQQLTRNTLEAWDSFGHVNLMIELEKEFNIKINATDYILLYSDFDTILEYLHR